MYCRYGDKMTTEKLTKQKMECNAIEHICKLFNNGLSSIEAMEMISVFINFLINNDVNTEENYKYIMSLK